MPFSLSPIGNCLCCGWIWMIDKRAPVLSTNLLKQQMDNSPVLCSVGTRECHCDSDIMAAVEIK